MQLPFTHDQFLNVFGQYNAALWPAAAGLWILSATGLALLATGRASGRMLSAVLALQWLWAGAVYHLRFFVPINPIARVFGALFLLEGALFVWYGVVRGRLAFAWRPGRAPWQVLSAVLCLYALAYPAFALGSGLQWPRLPTFGVPCPTTLLTIGLLLAAEPDEVRGLGVIPFLWTLVGGSAALLLGITPDLMLFLASAGLILASLGSR
jgi:hypothetical protein